MSQDSTADEARYIRNRKTPHSDFHGYIRAEDFAKYQLADDYATELGLSPSSIMVNKLIEWYEHKVNEKQPEKTPLQKAGGFLDGYDRESIRNLQDDEFVTLLKNLGGVLNDIQAASQRRDLGDHGEAQRAITNAVISIQRMRLKEEVPA